MTEITPSMDNLTKDLQPISDTKVAPAVGVAAIALNMAMKYHDIGTVQDGTLYQQYKLEGKNLAPLHIDMVLDTAVKLEMWLLGASERIASIIVEAVQIQVEDDEAPLDEETNRNGP